MQVMEYFCVFGNFFFPLNISDIITTLHFLLFVFRVGHFSQGLHSVCLCVCMSFGARVDVYRIRTFNNYTYEPIMHYTDYIDMK